MIKDSEDFAEEMRRMNISSPSNLVKLPLNLVKAMYQKSTCGKAKEYRGNPGGIFFVDSECNFVVSGCEKLDSYDHLK